ncbi:hypothetical protein [Moraxella bovis]|uniref:hypothetical protein n=1 Tax=Moraxella bovis TaxID=476 RepID=UPI0022276928|nr:hypothetical protein [Moraxella bovis]UZA39135.1 hypothetical protein LP101_06240 [Moraxella bovis]
MMTDYPNLDLIRAVMSQKSTSDHAGNFGKGGQNALDMADGAGCLAYVSKHAPTDNPDLMRSAVACYVDDGKRERFYNDVVKLAEQGYQSKSQRRKHAKNLARAVVADVVQCALTDKQKAEIMGISAVAFCNYHSHIYGDVMGAVATQLSIADDVAGEYWRKTFREHRG